MYAKYLMIGALLLGPGPGLAHEARGTHGGRIADAGSYHVELVVKSDVVDISGWRRMQVESFDASRSLTPMTLADSLLAKLRTRFGPQ